MSCLQPWVRPGMYFDPLYMIIVAVGMGLSGLASLWTRRAFARYSQVATGRGMTGAQVAAAILDAEGIQDVTIERVAGRLSDHYDPRAACFASAQRPRRTQCRRCGCGSPRGRPCPAGRAGLLSHAHSQPWCPWRASERTSACTWPSAGSLGFTGLAYLGVALFAGVLFTVVTFPVELDASIRARRTLEQHRLLDGAELTGVSTVLTAAAATYLAAAVSAVLQLLYWLMRGRARRPRRLRQSTSRGPVCRMRRRFGTATARSSATMSRAAARSPPRLGSGDAAGRPRAPARWRPDRRIPRPLRASRCRARGTSPTKPTTRAAVLASMASPARRPARGCGCYGGARCRPHRWRRPPRHGSCGLRSGSASRRGSAPGPRKRPRRRRRLRPPRSACGPPPGGLVALGAGTCVFCRARWAQDARNLLGVEVLPDPHGEPVVLECVLVPQPLDAQHGTGVGLRDGVGQVCGDREQVDGNEHQLRGQGAVVGLEVTGDAEAVETEAQQAGLGLGLGEVHWEERGRPVSCRVGEVAVADGQDTTTAAGSAEMPPPHDGQERFAGRSCCRWARRAPQARVMHPLDALDVDAQDQLLGRGPGHGRAAEDSRPEDREAPRLSSSRDGRTKPASRARIRPRRWPRCPARGATPAGRRRRAPWLQGRWVRLPRRRP